jgi:nicotinamidase-related amidase
MDEHTEPHWATSALLTIDVQRGVLDGGAMAIPGTSAALPAMARLVEGFRRSGRPVVHIVRLYLRDGSNAERCRRGALARGADLLIAGTGGAELAGPLLPDGRVRLDVEGLLAGRVQELSAHEHILFKPRWGAFHRTRLEEHLRDRGIDTVVFVGANFPNCPRTSMYEASERDFRVVCVRDAVSGLYDKGIAELEGIGAAMMLSGEVAGALGAQ